MFICYRFSEIALPMGFMDFHGKALCVESARLFMVMVCVQWLNSFMLILSFGLNLCAHDFNVIQSVML